MRAWCNRAVITSYPRHILAVDAEHRGGSLLIRVQCVQRQLLALARAHDLDDSRRAPCDPRANPHSLSKEAAPCVR